MRVLIGGGSGFIGSHLTRMLVSRNHEVLHISRTPRNNALTWSHIERKGLPASIDAVVNLAGSNLMEMKRFDEKFKTQLRSSRIETNRRLVNAIKQSANPVKVFIAASAVGVYPPSPTVHYTEESSGGSSSDFMVTLCRDNEAAAKLPDGSQTRSVIVRIGLALGRDGGAIAQMIRPFWFGLGGPIADGRQWFPWIHVDDVAGIMIHAIENDHVTGILNATAPDYINNFEFTQAFAKQLRRPAVLPVPGFALNLVYGEERAKTLTSGQKVIPKRTVESGYEFLYPDIQSACREFGIMFHIDFQRNLKL